MLISLLCIVVFFFGLLLSINWYDILDKTLVDTILHHSELADTAQIDVLAILNVFCVWLFTLMFFLTRICWLLCLGGVLFAMLILASTWFGVVLHIVVEFSSLLCKYCIKHPQDWYRRVLEKEESIAHELAKEEQE